jgi:carbon-monoxide dehydrogenase medium subunit
MIPAAFDYVRAGSVDEAVQLAGRPGHKLIAGGQSLLPLMKLRLARPETLVDIGSLAELKGVRTLPDGRVAIGALTTYAELMDSPAMHYGVLRTRCPTSATSRCAIAAPSAARSRTATRHRTSRPSCSPSTPRS